jgi:predicted Zn-dependent protease with MMP-like domain
LPPAPGPSASSARSGAVLIDTRPDDQEDRRRDSFERLVADALATIPSPFAEQLATVAILIEDEPLPGQVQPGTRLFGRYEGVPRTVWGADGAPLPSRITIFRRAHEEAHPDELGRSERVRSTVLHELAHHLGIDEARIRSIESGRGWPGR